MWLDKYNPSLHSILEGKLFCGGHIFQAVANDASGLIRIKGGTKPVLVDFSVMAGGKCYVTPHKATTYSAAGTDVALNNRNLGSANTTSTTIEHTPTVNILGTACAQTLVPGSSGGAGNRVGAGFNEEYGFLLPAGADILFELTNKSGGAIDIGATIFVSEMS